MLGAALLPHALGALVRWRGWSVWIGGVLAVVGLAVYVVLALEPSTTTLGLPGVRHLARDRHPALREGGTSSAPPRPRRPTTDGAILLAVLAVWAMAAFADWLAFVRHTALAAVSPALVFFVWTSTLGTDDAQLLLTVGFCVATGVFVLAQNLASARPAPQLARVAARRAAALAGPGRGARAAPRSSWRSVVAPLLPGASSDPLLDVAGPGRDGTGGHSYKPSLAPFVDIGRKLHDVDNRELFTVKSGTPDYWRIAALDTYSGERGGEWTLSAEGDGQRARRACRRTRRTRPTSRSSTSVRSASAGCPPRTSRPRSACPTRWWSSRRAPSSPTPTTSPDCTTRWGRTCRRSRAMRSHRPGSPATTPRSRRACSGSPSSPRPPTSSRSRPRRERSSTPPVPPRRTRRRQALRDFFRDPANGFVYDTNVDDHDDAPAILAFLQNRHGFCVQFASAYAVMARSLGIPARVAVGFTPGTREATAATT